MTVINHLSMQEYLYGVVPREIGGASPIEAVKAQAILARTFATKNYGRRSTLGFDLYPTSTDQAYSGYDWEHSNSNQAVDETEGMVVTYDGELIGGYYFSTSGGHTEDCKNVWGSDYPYLKGVEDPYEPYIKGNTEWEVTMTQDEVTKKLKDNKIDVGRVIDLEVTKRSDSGKVIELTVYGENGTDTVTNSRTREYLGLKSQWYTINEEAPSIEFSKTDKEDDEITNEEQNEDEDNKWWEDNDKEDEEPPKTEFENKKVFEETTIVIKEDEQAQNIIIDDTDLHNDIIEKRPFLKSLLNSISSMLFVRPMNSNSSNKLKLLKSDSKDFTFRGRGWGHGIGMSQNGAIGMAREGFSAEEIIKWYYTGVEIEE